MEMLFLVKVIVMEWSIARRICMAASRISSSVRTFIVFAGLFGDMQ